MSEENNTPKPPTKRMRLDANFFAAMASASKTKKKESSGPPSPLPIEPCTIQRLKEHRALLQSEIDEYRDLLHSKMAEMDQANDRIEYLQYVRKNRPKNADKRLCITEGCTKFSQKLGLCNEHGASKVAKRCIFEGCTNHAKQKGGLCRKHGVRTYCETGGCNRLATKGNLCNIHRTDYYTRNRLYCAYNEEDGEDKDLGIEGRCWNHRKRGVYCVKHWKIVCKCISPNCDNEAVGKSRSCMFCLELEKAAAAAAASNTRQGSILDVGDGSDLICNEVGNKNQEQCDNDSGNMTVGEGDGVGGSEMHDLSNGIKAASTSTTPLEASNDDVTAGDVGDEV